MLHVMPAFRAGVDVCTENPKNKKGKEKSDREEDFWKLLDKKWGKQVVLDEPLCNENETVAKDVLSLHAG